MPTLKEIEKIRLEARKKSGKTEEQLRQELIERLMRYVQEIEEAHKKAAKSTLGPFKCQQEASNAIRCLY